MIRWTRDTPETECENLTIPPIQMANLANKTAAAAEEFKRLLHAEQVASPASRTP